MIVIIVYIVGAGLGGAIVPFGSFATLTWLKLLEQHDLQIGWWSYLRLHLVLTLPVLFITLLTLILWLPWLRA